MKILTKIKRRADGDELPKRGHLVEMELYDTDRNPLDLSAARSLWTRHDYDIHVPFIPPNAPFVWGTQLLGPMPLTIDRTSLVGAFIGGTFHVDSGAGEGKYVKMQIQLDRIGGGNTISAYDEQTFLTDDTDYRMPGYLGVGWAIADTGDYQVSIWCWREFPSGETDPVIHMTEFAASLAVLPAGLLSARGPVDIT